MPVYATAEQVRSVLARDLNRPGAPELAALDDSEIDAAVGSAQAEVEARTSGVYSPPTLLEDVPRLIVDCTVDIAAYLLVLRYTPGELPDSDVTALRYQRALNLLTGIQSGVVDLPTPPAGVPTPPTGAVINPYEGRLFDLDTWELGYGGARGRW